MGSGAFYCWQISYIYKLFKKYVYNLDPVKYIYIYFILFIKRILFVFYSLNHIYLKGISELFQLNPILFMEMSFATAVTSSNVDEHSYLLLLADFLCFYALELRDLYYCVNQ